MKKDITCLHCDETVYEMTGEPKRGDIIKASDFKGVNGYNSPNNGDEMLCPNCDRDLRYSLELAIGLSVVP